jgi:hypothetical protein
VNRLAERVASPHEQRVDQAAHVEPLVEAEGDLQQVGPERVGAACARLGGEPARLERRQRAVQRRLRDARRLCQLLQRVAAAARPQLLDHPQRAVDALVPVCGASHRELILRGCRAHRRGSPASLAQQAL